MSMYGLPTIQGIGGALQAGTGAVFCDTGIGCLLGGYLVFSGTDDLQNSIRNFGIEPGKQVDTLRVQGLQALGMEKETAHWATTIADLSAGGAALWKTYRNLNRYELLTAESTIGTGKLAQGETVSKESNSVIDVADKNPDIPKPHNKSEHQISENPQADTPTKEILDKDSANTPKPSGTCEAPPNCFAAGTLIQTIDGLKPIEQIQRGDLVWSRQEFGDAYAYKPVFETKVTENQQVYEVIVENSLGETETYLATSEHPFYIADLGWLKASLLEAGMPLLDRNGNIGSLKVKSRTKLERWEAVYNFEVDEFATYHIGHLGVWVHNANCCELANQKTATETRDGVINHRKLQEGSIDLDLTPTTQKQVDDIVNHGDARGNKTESLFEAVVQEHGGTVLSGGKYGSNNGYDHVIVFKDSDGNTYLTMTVDSKQLNSKGVRLDPKAAGGKMQMSDKWDEVVLEKLDPNSEARMAIRDAQRNGNLVKGIAYVDKQTGQLKLVRIDPKTR